MANFIVLPGGLRPAGPPTRALAGTPKPRSARVALSLALVRGDDRRRTSLEVPIHRQAEREKAQAGERLGWLLEERVEHERQRRGDEDRRDIWVAPDSVRPRMIRTRAPQPEQSDRADHVQPDRGKEHVG